MLSRDRKNLLQSVNFPLLLRHNFLKAFSGLLMTLDLIIDEFFVSLEGLGLSFDEFNVLLADVGNTAIIFTFQFLSLLNSDLLSHKQLLDLAFSYDRLGFQVLNQSSGRI